jgi:hypothetical protein
MSLDQSLDSRFDAYVSHLRSRAKASSIAQVRVSQRHFRRILGDLPADRVTPAAIDRFVAQRLDEGVKPASVNVSLRNLRAALNHGGLRHVDVKLLRVGRKRKLAVLDRDDVEALIQAAPAPYDGILLVAALRRRGLQEKVARTSSASEGSSAPGTLPRSHRVHAKHRGMLPQFEARDRAGPMSSCADYAACVNRACHGPSA